MNKRYFIYNGRLSLDFDIVIDSIDSPTPAEISSRQQIPFTNNTINTAEMLGYKTYERRTITIQFQIICDDSEALEIRLISIKKWLMNPINTVLRDSANTTHQYQGVCCESVSVVDKQYGYADVVATFSAAPCMANLYPVSQVMWDSINFLTDSVRNLTFSASNGQIITLYNEGIEPTALMLTSDKNVTFMVDGISYTHLAGKSYCSFYLLPGTNNFKVICDGTVSLDFDWNEGGL